MNLISQQVWAMGLSVLDCLKYSSKFNNFIKIKHEQINQVSIRSLTSLAINEYASFILLFKISSKFNNFIKIKHARILIKYTMNF